MIEEAINEEDSEYRIEIGSVFLTWPRWRETILLGLGKTTLYEKDEEVLALNKVLLGLSARELLFAKLRPSKIIIRDISYDVSGLLQKPPTDDKITPPEENNIDFSFDNFKVFSALKTIQLRDVVISNGIHEETSEPKAFALANIILNRYAANTQADIYLRLLEDHQKGRLGAQDYLVHGQSYIKKENGRWVAPTVVSIPEISMSKLQNIVPQNIKNTEMGKWLGYKISDGLLKDVSVDLNVTARSSLQSIDVSDVKVSFKGDGLTIKYVDTLMPVTEVIAEGLYENDTLTITGTSGKIGDITGRNIKVKMVDLSVKGGGHADISLDASGPLKTALKYIGDEPIGVKDQLGFSPDDVNGNIDFSLQLNFPTIKDLPKEEVIVKIDGTLNDVEIPDMVKGLPLSGGPYALQYDDGLINLDGSGALGHQTLNLKWKQYLNSEGKEFESKIEAKIIADEKLRDAFGIDLKEYISGDVPVDVTYIDKGKTETVDVQGNLLPTTFHIESLYYKREENIEGNLSLKAYLKQGTLEEIDNLSLETKGFSVQNGRILFKSLSDGSVDISRGTIEQAILGRSNVSVDFENTGKGILKVILNGEQIDIGPYIDTGENKPKLQEEKNNHQPLILSAKANKMIAHNKEKILHSQLYLESDSAGDITRIEMDAKIGKGDFYLRFKPDEKGERSFQLEATDAGQTLKVFGLYDKIRGGTLKIIGKPQRGDNRGDLYGSAIIKDFHLRKAPGLAKILGSMSIDGLGDLLQNEGIEFRRLESDFEWRFRENGNLLVLKDGRTSGAAIGLTFEGVVDQKEATIDLSGTVIPVSGVNNLLGDIPVLGTLLTGGDALIAATYTLSGPAQDPVASINPLSVLAPGFLRKLFFEKDVKNPEKEKEQNTSKTKEVNQ